MKLYIQAQQLQPGDIVGSGEVIEKVVLSSFSFPSTKVMIVLSNGERQRSSYWGKYKMILVERPDND